MAGYRLTFDGSLNERRDVAEVTSTSDLSLRVDPGPSTGWEGEGVFDPMGYTFTDPVSYGYYGSGNAQVFSGGITTVTPSFGLVQSLFNPIMPRTTGTYQAQLRVRAINCTAFETIQYKNALPDGPTGNYAPNTWITYTVNFSTVNEAYMFRFQQTYTSGSTAARMEIDYIRVIDLNSNVVVTPSTFTNGAVPTGGIATIASPSTLIGGQSGIAGVPKLFGAKVVHDASDVLSAKYLPPATSIQDAESKLSKSKYITATSTSISVESEGLGGAEKLGAGKTSIVVENIPATVEN